MTDLDDLELNKPSSGPPPRRRSSGALIAAVVFVAALVTGALVWRPWNRPAPAPDPSAAGPRQETVAPAPEPVIAPEPVLPSLEGSDEPVRELAADLSSHPLLRAWLAGQHLVRNFAVVVENVGRGVSPARHLKPLAPRAPFRVASRAGRTVIDARSYTRYDGAIEAFASLDAARCATVYQKLRPLIAAALRELGYQRETPDELLRRAFTVLLDTPVVERDIEVRPRGIVYAYADPALENLNGAQKHLLRTGPRNVGRVQAKIRELSHAIGLPGFSE